MPIMNGPPQSDGKGSQGVWKPGWTCPRCHETVPEWFESCWNCSETKPFRIESSTDRIVEIDGLLFSNLTEFSSHFEERTGLAPCCGNLDILNEVLTRSMGLARLRGASSFVGGITWSQRSVLGHCSMRLWKLSGVMARAAGTRRTTCAWSSYDGGLIGV